MQVNSVIYTAANSHLKYISQTVLQHYPQYVLVNSFTMTVLEATLTITLGKSLS